MLSRDGTPLSRTAVLREILKEEGLSRMPKLAPASAAGPAPERLAAPKVRVLGDEDWPAEGSIIQTQHAGLFLLIGELIALDLPGLVKAAGWPSTSQLQAQHSVLSLLALSFRAPAAKPRTRGRA